MENAAAPLKTKQSIYAKLSVFIVEYTLLFLYIYSFVMIHIKNLAIMGWTVLFLTHFVSTVNALLQTFSRIGEPIVSVIIACFILVLVGLFYIAVALFNVQQKLTLTNMAIPPILQSRLNMI